MKAPLFARVAPLFLLFAAYACSGKPPRAGSGGGGAGGTPADGATCRQAAVDGSGSRCSRSGKLTCHGANVACPAYDAAPVTVGLVTTAYQGAMPKCEALPDPTDGRGFSIAVTVESVEAKVFPVNGASQLETWVQAVRTDVTPHCGLLINFRSLTERPHVEPGMALRVSSRTVIRTDTDIPGINVVSTEAGAVLYALVLSASVRNFKDDLGDLVPGLAVATGTDPLCVDASGNAAFSLSLSVDNETCTADSQASRCCTLWGRGYELDVLKATAGSGSSGVQAAFALRAEGFFTRD